MVTAQSESEKQRGSGSFTLSVIKKLDALADPEKCVALSEIWDDVVHRIIEAMLEAADPHIESLHFNLREELVFELAKLQVHIAQQVAIKRMGECRVSELDVEAERQICLGPDGLKIIENTARIYAEHVWIKLYKERWAPKTKMALERESNPKQPVLAVKTVAQNHYIPKWFIRDHWSENGKIKRFRRDDTGGWTARFTGTGNWGYASNLYSDRLEAYFGLIEGDAKKPVHKLLNTIPLNQPEREALVGFIVIQIIRNPAFMERLKTGVSPIVAETVSPDKTADPEYMRRVYETLFESNDFYNRFAGPTLRNAWALIRSKEPVFVLPDIFCCTCRINQETHFLVPLTPFLCFSTLPRRERTMRIIPYSYEATPELARQTSALLSESARNEFLAHENFEPTTRRPEDSPPLADLLRKLESGSDNTIGE